MGSVRVVMNVAGSRDLRNSPGVQAALLAAAMEWPKRDGMTPLDGDVRPGRTRSHARVRARTSFGVGFRGLH
jgi:hypothetical protein